ncbi:MAG: metallophosphoesterase [Clostridium sp.]|nr:metallophosphoesterase [Clostridium sp.]
MKTKKYIFITFISIFIFWLVWTNINITTTHIEIENKKIPSGFDDFKIAQVSDLHNYQWSEKLIRKINMESPDIIAITGDLVDSSKTDFDVALQFIQDTNKIAPIYYVTGNHEAWLEDYSVLKEQLEKLNVNMMDDRSLFIEKDSNKIQILGVQDPDFVERMNSGNIQGEIVRIKTSEILNKDYFNIVLSHRPEHFEEYVKVGADLVLTGHAHGGQVRIPFFGGLVAPNQGFFPEYTEGIYNKKNTDMIVSRGLGNSIIPIRINNTPELVIIKLKTK